MLKHLLWPWNKHLEQIINKNTSLTAKTTHMSSPFPDFSGRYPPRVFALVAAAHHHHELWQSQPTSWEKVKTSKNPRRTFQLVWTRIADATFQGSRFLGHMIISSRSGSILYHVPPWNQKLGKQCISQTFNNPLKTYGNRLDELKTWCPNHFPLLNYLIKPVNNGITSSQGLVILHHMMCTKKKSTFTDEDSAKKSS